MHCSLKRAAELVNSLEGTRYAKVLARILQRLHLKVCGRGSARTHTNHVTHPL